MEFKWVYYLFLFVFRLLFLYFLYRKRCKLYRCRYFVFGFYFVWYIDGFDKIKLFVFGISRCIDGFLWKMLWLNVYKINNDLKVIVGYFVEIIVEMFGCLFFVRGDRGIEDILVKEF